MQRNISGREEKLTDRIGLKIERNKIKKYVKWTEWFKKSGNQTE